MWTLHLDRTKNKLYWASSDLGTRFYTLLEAPPRWVYRKTRQAVIWFHLDRPSEHVPHVKRIPGYATDNTHRALVTRFLSKADQKILHSRRKLKAQRRRAGQKQSSVALKSGPAVQRLETGQAVQRHYNQLQRNVSHRRHRSSVLRLRKFNNWVKSCLIRFCQPAGADVLDLACGKGADFFKWTREGITGYTGVDFAYQSLVEFRDRLEQQNCELPCTLIHAELPELNVPSMYDTVDGYDPPCFQVVSCQFALHYMSDLRAFFQAWAPALDEKGYFIATTVDAEAPLVRRAREQGSVTVMDDCDREVCYIRFETETTYYMRMTEYDTEAPDAPGQVYVEGVEHVVRPEQLVEEAGLSGLVLVQRENFHNFAVSHGDDPLLSVMVGPATIGAPKKESSSANDDESSSVANNESSSAASQNVGMSRAEWELAGLYCAYTFQKKDPPPRVAIVVPFRDTEGQNRSEQLKRFVPHMERVMDASLVPYRIYIVEQQDLDLKFNRGKLLNVGARQAIRDGCTRLVLHDVDLLPSLDLSAAYAADFEAPCHLARVWGRYSADDPTYIGGVLGMSVVDFCRCNGFPNDYWGWGGEDQALRRRLDLNRLDCTAPSKGSYEDLENMSLQEKLASLRSHTRSSDTAYVNDWKNVVKTELLRQHDDTWRQNGFRSLRTRLEKRALVRSRVHLIRVRLGLNGSEKTYPGDAHARMSDAM